MFVVFCFNVVTNLKPYVLSLLYNILWEISSFSRIFGGSVNMVTILVTFNALNLIFA